MENRTIIFYDDDCGVCRWSMHFIARRDSQGLFQFAPIGGETFRKSLPESVLEEGRKTVLILEPGGKVSDRSDAVLRILRRLGLPWRFFARLGFVLPRPMRDSAYNAFARNRGRLFKTCNSQKPAPPRSFRSRLLR